MSILSCFLCGQTLRNPMFVKSIAVQTQAEHTSGYIRTDSLGKNWARLILVLLHGASVNNSRTQPTKECST